MKPPVPASTAPVTLYGIPNCDTVRRTRAWLTAHGVGYKFHDFKKQGVPADRLGPWMQALGWEKLLNRQGATWRKLDDATRAAVTDAVSAQALMLAQPSVIKRPVIDWGQRLTLGFVPEQWNSLAQK